MPALESFDGTRLAYDVDGPDEGPAVVLLHGFASDATASWRETGIVAALVTAGFRVVTFDARGHGRSAKPHDDEAYRPPAMARDVSAVLDEVGAESADLVGYSMGSTTAIVAASIEPRVRRLVLGGAGSTLLAANDESARQRRRLGAAALDVDDASTLTHPAAVGLRRFVDASPLNDRKALAAVMRAEEGLPPGALDVTTPTLVLTGRDDDGAGDPQALADALPDAVARLVDGHHLSAVRDPGFTAAVVEFLS